MSIEYILRHMTFEQLWLMDPKGLSQGECRVLHAEIAVRRKYRGKKCPGRRFHELDPAAIILPGTTVLPAKGVTPVIPVTKKTRMK
jgi:hypothetical protein